MIERRLNHATDVALVRTVFLVDEFFGHGAL